MPIYEYVCANCSSEFEELRSFTHMNAPAACPECSGQGEKQLSVFMSFTTDAGGETRAVAGGGGCCGGGGGGACACAASV